MQLLKQQIRTNNHKTTRNIQLTIDEDVNVPDSRQDMDKLILSQGKVVIDESEPMVDRIRVKGHVSFQMLYSAGGDKADLDAMDGTVSFEETINVDNLLPSYETKVSCELEDLTVSMIHSRKVEVKGLVSLTIHVTEPDVIEGATDIENGDQIQCMYIKVPYMRTVADQKDIYRIRENVTIPQSKPNIHHLIWHCVTLNEAETKPLDNKIAVRGELEIFLIYHSEDQASLQYLNLDIPFSGEVDCTGCMEGMTADIGVALADTSVTVVPDEDGEARVLNVEVNLDLDIRIYQEEEMALLGDMFSTTSDIQAETEAMEYESLVVHNNAQTRIVERIRRQDNQPKILQVCYIEGDVKVDDMHTTQEGIQVEGAVAVRILYIAEDDAHPMNCLTGYLPFTYLVEVKDLSPDTIYRIRPSLEQISSIMLGSDEVEIKAVVNLKLLAFEKKKCRVITDMSVSDINYEAMNQLAGIVGYIVQDGDTLWNIAKRYYTTIDNLRSVNELTQDELHAGQKLVIVKG
ncbi:MAG: DUF3794 domain-containing protein [Lachnospiraceae bacterium]|nr:DUF3794 domain-containing protein [Lachnospiraceae bacterium]